MLLPDSIRIKKQVVWLFVIFLSLTDFANCATKIGGISSGDIAFLLCAGGCLWYLLKFRYVKCHTAVMVIAFVMVITSSLQSYFLYGQSLDMGIRAQRSFLASWLLFAVLQKLMTVNALTRNDIKSVIYSVAAIQMVVCVVQYAVGPKHYFMTALMGNSYFGMRVYVDAMFITLTFTFALAEILRGTAKKSDLFFLIGSVLVIVFVSQSRMSMITLLISTAIPIISMKGMSNKKIAFVVLIALIGIYFLNTDIAKSVIDSIRGNDATGSITTRFNAQEFYKGVIEQHPILGGGYINSQNPTAAYLGGLTRGFYVVDNGMYGFVFLYGIVGIVWAILIYFTLAKYAWMGWREKDFFFLIVLTRMILSFPSGVTWFYEWYSITTAIVLAIGIDANRRRMKPNNKYIGK